MSIVYNPGIITRDIIKTIILFLTDATLTGLLSLFDVGTRKYKIQGNQRSVQSNLKMTI